MDPQEQLAQLLRSSLEPDHAKTAESHLRAAETQPGFALLLLRLIQNDTYEVPARLAGALFFKNFLKRNWVNEEGVHNFPEEECAAIKSNIIVMMIQAPPTIQTQLGEAVNVIADTDFPQDWTNLLDDLIAQLDHNDFRKVIGALQTAHSIFKRWRPLFRTDDLFKEIGFVLSKFTGPFLDIFSFTNSQIQSHSNDKATLDLAARALLIECKLFYDLNCQDIPEFFEDNMSAFMSVFHFYLTYSNPLLESDDEEVPGILENIKSSICEIIQLYAQRYEDVFKPLPEFLGTVWQLLTSTGPERKFDELVGKAMSFLATVIKSPQHSQALNNEDALRQFVERVIIPNMRLRESDMEIFEDEPIEYIRRDIEGSDSDTRKRAASDLVSGLLDTFEANVSSVMMSYISHFLQEYSQNPQHNFLAKDIAYSLLSAAAVRTQSTKLGVSSTNVMFDIVSFFDANVAADLVATTINPIVRTDAIKFVYMFRNQLSLEQIRKALPVLINLISVDNYVVVTYASISIEKLLTLERDGHLVFSATEIAPLAPSIFTGIFGRFEKATNAHVLAENDYLMRCLVRTIMTLKEQCRASIGLLSRQLAMILNEVCKHPYNPRFNHYLFEAIGATVRFCGETDLAKLETTLYPVMQTILQNEIIEFVPYVFQILARMTELSSVPISPFLQSLVAPCLAPALWDSRGNIPPLTKFLQAVISKDPSVLNLDGVSLVAVLGVFQKLISSKVSDIYGFDLLETLFLSLPGKIQPDHVKHIFMLLLTRLQSARTERFLLRYVALWHFLSCLDSMGYGPQFVVNSIESVQPGLLTQIYNVFILPNTQKLANRTEKKFATVGMTKMLLFFETSQQYEQLYYPTLVALLKILEMPTEISHDTSAQLDDFDVSEDMTFQSTYSRLNTLAYDRLDPCPAVKDSWAYFVESMNAAHQQGPSSAFTNACQQMPAEGRSALQNYKVNMPL